MFYLWLLRLEMGRVGFIKDNCWIYRGQMNFLIMCVLRQVRITKSHTPLKCLTSLFEESKVVLKH